VAVTNFGNVQGPKQYSQTMQLTTEE